MKKGESDVDRDGVEFKYRILLGGERERQKLGKDGLGFLLCILLLTANDVSDVSTFCKL